MNINTIDYFYFEKKINHKKKQFPKIKNKDSIKIFYLNKIKNFKFLSTLSNKKIFVFYLKFICIYIKKYFYFNRLIYNKNILKK